MCALVGFALEQQMPDLRAVAEGQYELVRASERRECGRGRSQIATLHLGGDLFASARERVAAECSDDTHLNVPRRARCGSGAVRPAARADGGAVTTCFTDVRRLMSWLSRARLAAARCSLRTGGGTIRTGR